MGVVLAANGWVLFFGGNTPKSQMRRTSSAAGNNTVLAEVLQITKIK